MKPDATNETVAPPPVAPEMSTLSLEATLSKISVLPERICVLLFTRPPAPKALAPEATTVPPMRWDHHPEAAKWTTNTLIAVAEEDAVLAARVPADIAQWCPGYETASLPERRAF